MKGPTDDLAKGSWVKQVRPRKTKATGYHSYVGSELWRKDPSIRRKKTHRQTSGGQGRGTECGFGVSRWKLITYRMDTQQGPIIEHGEVYPISCDKPSWTRTRQCTCVCVCECVYYPFSCAWLFAPPWTVAHLLPLSVGLSKQWYWSIHTFICIFIHMYIYS